MEIPSLYDLTLESFKRPYYQMVMSLYRKQHRYMHAKEILEKYTKVFRNPFNVVFLVSEELNALDYPVVFNSLDIINSLEILKDPVKNELLEVGLKAMYFDKKSMVSFDMEPEFFRLIPSEIDENFDYNVMLDTLATISSYNGQDITKRIKLYKKLKPLSNKLFKNPKKYIEIFNRLEKFNNFILKSTFREIIHKSDYMEQELAFLKYVKNDLSKYLIP